MKNNMLYKVTISVFVLCCSIHSLFAVDFGGNIGNSSKVKKNTNSNYVLNQKNNVTGWLNIPFDNAASTNLAIQGSVFYKYDDTDIKHFGDNKTDVVIFDLDLFKLRTIKKIDEASVVQLSAGRFTYSDASGLVFAQPADSVFAQYSTSGFTASGYAGYTGLLNAQNVTVLNKNDSAYSFDADKSYDWASPYVVGGVSIGFPYVLGQQSFELQGFTAIGVDGPNDNADNSDYNRFYATAVVNGPIVHNIFYILTTTFGTEDMPDIGNITQLTFSYFTQFYNASIAWGSVYASGEHAGLKPFKGITSMTATYDATQPEYSGLFKTGVSASIKPIKPLFLRGGSDIVFDCPKDEFEYGGVQVFADARYQLLRDCNISVFFARFMGKDDERTNTELTVKAVLAF